VRAVAGVIFDVLVEVAAEQHAHELRAAADADERQVLAQRVAHRGEVAQIAVQVGVDAARVALLAVDARVDVGRRSRQHERVGACHVEPGLVEIEDPHPGARPRRATPGRAPGRRVP
jgi:hypothetical protein